MHHLVDMTIYTHHMLIQSMNIRSNDSNNLFSIIAIDILNIVEVDIHNYFHVYQVLHTE